MLYVCVLQVSARLFFKQAILWLFLSQIVYILSACDSEPKAINYPEEQKLLLLDAINEIHQAGLTLRSNTLSQTEVEQVLIDMDNGLQKAWQVNQQLLLRLHPDMPQIFDDAFIKGVEQYRIGVEGADTSMQKQGLLLLNKWGDFWEKNHPQIMQLLDQSISE